VSDETRLIEENITRHERIASQYDKRHSEIYNSVEQSRLRSVLQEAINARTPLSSVITAFDLGCGAGNLTDQLVELGCRVTAADVTPSFVAMVTSRHPERVSGLLLNGSDLSNVESETYDLVATYSVLHHIPDYLSVVREMARITRRGGVVLIDHEWSAGNWNPSPALIDYRSKTSAPRDLRWYMSRLLRPGWWYTRLRQLIEPRYQEEGDIHVWPDDHIEWEIVEQTLSEDGFEIVVSRDYLLYEPHVAIEVYERYHEHCSNMHCCIALKR